MGANEDVGWKSGTNIGMRITDKPERTAPKKEGTAPTKQIEGRETSDEYGNRFTTQERERGERGK